MQKLLNIRLISLMVPDSLQASAKIETVMIPRIPIKGRHPEWIDVALGYTDVYQAITLAKSHIPVLWMPAIHSGMVTT
jgi:hypothetical protein